MRVWRRGVDECGGMRGHTAVSLGWGRTSRGSGRAELTLGASNGVGHRRGRGRRRGEGQL
eukprot:1146089-Pelagomonas_calceolata.AAC.3